jgi:hypothetical protein
MLRRSWRIWLIGWVCVFLFAAASAEAGVVALKPDTTKEVLPGEDIAGRKLPDKLVIRPGRYAYVGRSYKLTRGAYRFGRGYRIVFNGAPRPLMSGIAWLTHHRLSTDNQIPPQDLGELATQRPLDLSCGGVSRFAAYELDQLGIAARRVALVTPYEMTPYTGHTVMELDWHGWQVYDLDYNMRPLVEGHPTRAIGYVKAPDDRLSFDWLSGDANRFSRLPDNYRYQMGTALIEDGANFYFTAPVDHTPEELTTYSHGWYQYLPRQGFMARFYP